MCGDWVSGIESKITQHPVALIFYVTKASVNVTRRNVQMCRCVDMQMCRCVNMQMRKQNTN